MARSPLSLKSHIHQAVLAAIVEVAEKNPGCDSDHLLKLVDEHPSNYPVSCLLAAIDQTLWVAESARLLS